MCFIRARGLTPVHAAAERRDSPLTLSKTRLIYGEPPVGGEGEAEPEEENRCIHTSTVGVWLLWLLASVWTLAPASQNKSPSYQMLTTYLLSTISVLTLLHCTQVYHHKQQNINL